MTTPRLGTSTLEDTRTDPQTDDGDDERYSHYVKKDKLMSSMVEGSPMTALCGKVWVPSRDPEKFPLCPKCKELMDMLHSWHGEGDDGAAGSGGAGD